MSEPEPIYVRKRDLPIPLVVTGEDGITRVLEIAPAGKGRLSAYIIDASPAVKEKIRKRGRRK